MAAFRTRDHCLRGPLVSAVLAFLSGRRGITHGAESACGPHHHLVLGAALRTRTEQEMPAGIETNQRLLEGRRNLHLPGWELAVPVSRRRFHRRHDRLLVFR